MADKEIQSFTVKKWQGNLIRVWFKFTDGSTAIALYHKKTGKKDSGLLPAYYDAENAPYFFDPKKQAQKKEKQLKQATTSNLNNLQKLESNNFVQNNAPLPNYKDSIASAVNSNKPDMLACIGQKIKDIIGIFTLPFGLPLEIPNLPDIPKLSIGEIFNNVLNDLLGAALSVEQTVLGTISGITSSITSTIEIGDLSVSKFLGCDELAVSTPTQKKELATSPVKQQQVTTAAVQTSTTNLQAKAEKKVEQKVEPVKTAQKTVPAITQVEEEPAIPFEITGTIPLQYTFDETTPDDEVLFVFNGNGYSNKKINILFQDAYKAIIEKVNLGTVKANQKFDIGEQKSGCDMELILTIVSDTKRIWKKSKIIDDAHDVKIDWFYRLVYTKKGQELPTTKLGGTFRYGLDGAYFAYGGVQNPNDAAKLILGEFLNGAFKTDLLPQFVISKLEDLPTQCKI